MNRRNFYRNIYKGNKNGSRYDVHTYSVDDTDSGLTDAMEQ